MIEALTAAEATEVLRNAGLRITPETIRDGFGVRHRHSCVTEGEVLCQVLNGVTPAYNGNVLSVNQVQCQQKRQSRLRHRGHSL